jgi:chromosome segregation ATPase
MVRAAFILSLPLFATATAWAQSAAPGPPALEALVSEIRQLRQDLQATTVAAQRVQIALFRLQTQTTAVARAASRLDDLHSRLSQIQTHQREVASRLQHFEEQQRDSHDPNELKVAAEVVPQLKAELDRQAPEEQLLQASEAETASQLRSEQAKLSDLQDQLDRLDKVLASFDRK